MSQLDRFSPTPPETYALLQESGWQVPRRLPMGDEAAKSAVARLRAAIEADANYYLAEIATREASTLEPADYLDALFEQEWQRVVGGLEALGFRVSNDRQDSVAVNGREHTVIYVGGDSREEFRKRTLFGNRNPYFDRMEKIARGEPLEGFDARVFAEADGAQLHAPKHWIAERLVDPAGQLLHQRLGREETLEGFAIAARQAYERAFGVQTPAIGSARRRTEVDPSQGEPAVAALERIPTRRLDLPSVSLKQLEALARDYQSWLGLDNGQAGTAFSRLRGVAEQSLPDSETFSADTPYAITQVRSWLETAVSKSIAEYNPAAFSGIPDHKRKSPSCEDWGFYLSGPVNGIVSRIEHGEITISDDKSLPKALEFIEL